MGRGKGNHPHQTPKIPRMPNKDPNLPKQPDRRQPKPPPKGK